MANRNWWPKPPRNVAGRWEYGSLTFWAEGGGIYVIDQDPRADDPETTKTITLPQWVARLRAQKDYLAHVIRDQHRGSPQQIAIKTQIARAVAGLVRAMETVARDAQRQGDLTEASVQRYYRDHVATVRQTHLVPNAILPG